MQFPVSFFFRPKNKKTNAIDMSIIVWSTIEAGGNTKTLKPKKRTQSVFHYVQITGTVKQQIRVNS